MECRLNCGVMIFRRPGIFLVAGAKIFTVERRGARWFSWSQFSFWWIWDLNLEYLYIACKSLSYYAEKLAKMNVYSFYDIPPYIPVYIYITYNPFSWSQDQVVSDALAASVGRKPLTSASLQGLLRLVAALSGVQFLCFSCEETTFLTQRLYTPNPIIWSNRVFGKDAGCSAEV